MSRREPLLVLLERWVEAERLEVNARAVGLDQRAPAVYAHVRREARAARLAVPWWARAVVAVATRPDVLWRAVGAVALIALAWVAARYL